MAPSVQKNIFKYIRSQKWFFGVRAEETLFFYSAKFFNREKLLRQYYKCKFVETLLFPLKSDYPVRVFNLMQAKAFHQKSLDKINRNPSVLEKFIERDNKNWQEIDAVINQLEKQIKLKNFKQSKALFLKLIKKYGIYGNFFFIIFSQGMVMTKNQEDLGSGIKAILKKHDLWRNSVAFKEEKLGRAVYLFIKMFAEQKSLDISPNDILKFLTADEVLALLSGKLKSGKIKLLIDSRGKHGYLFAFLHNKTWQGVIVDQQIVNNVKVYFSEILSEDKKESGNLEGMSAFIVPQKIKGEVVVIADKNKLAENTKSLTGKILVSIQTTPHFIPYLKKVKAIITDEGGVTCHAAIVSREFKIPCIVGTKNATKVLKTGDRVELDTQKGIIRKM